MTSPMTIRSDRGTDTVTMPLLPTVPLPCRIFSSRFTSRGVAGFVGFFWGSGVEVALSTRWTRLASATGSPTPRKGMNHSIGSRSK